MRFLFYSSTLAESIIGLFTTDVINFIGPWISTAQVEWETCEWVAWYNTERLHGAIGYITPTEAKDLFYADLTTHDKAA